MESHAVIRWFQYKNFFFLVYLKTINKRRYWYVLRIHFFKEIYLILWNITLLTSGVLKKLIVCFTLCTLFFNTFVSYCRFVCRALALGHTVTRMNAVSSRHHDIAWQTFASLGLLTFACIACLLQLWIRTSDLFGRRPNNKTRNKSLATWRRIRSKSFVYSYN